jgi:hypothetical protein
MAKHPVLSTRKKLTLAEVQARFRSWRKGKKPGDRIPPRLWTAAVKVCEAHSLCEVSRTLGLNHTDLKRRRAAWKGETEQPSPAGFVELCLPAPPCSCVVELTQASGATLKMTFQGLRPDPVSLIRAFRSQGS